MATAVPCSKFTFALKSVLAKTAVARIGVHDLLLCCLVAIIPKPSEEVWLSNFSCSDFSHPAFTVPSISKIEAFAIDHAGRNIGKAGIAKRDLAVRPIRQINQRGGHRAAKRFADPQIGCRGINAVEVAKIVDQEAGPELITNDEIGRIINRRAGERRIDDGNMICADHRSPPFAWCDGGEDEG